MPLEAKEPTFDRPFEDIYRELRARIPLFNPQWTNYNDSDPGITLLQLFGWLAEMTLHKMNDVPRKNYLKFARQFNEEFPGFETDIHGLRAKVDANGKKRYYADCVRSGG